MSLMNALIMMIPTWRMSKIWTFATDTLSAGIAKRLGNTVPSTLLQFAPLVLVRACALSGNSSHRQTRRCALAVPPDRPTHAHAPLRYLPPAPAWHSVLDSRNMLQQPHLHQSDICPALLRGHAQQNDFRVHELSRALHHNSPHISFIEGQPQVRATDSAGFLAAVRNPPRQHPLLNCAIRTIHPGVHPSRHDRGIRLRGEYRAVLLPLYDPCARMYRNGL